jgi:small subunit ribosomal protein S6
LRDYELTVVFSPELSDDDMPSAIDKVAKFIAQKGGVVSEVDHWGRRRLAYPISRFIEGNYVLTRIQLEPQAVADLEANLELSESVLRYLVVKREQ